ncbi:hypothetical protein WA577_006078 [Blastocystis sp. JDR]
MQSAIRANCRCFSAIRATQKPKHHYVEHAPSERKIKRDARKKENQKLVDSYKKLDEEAAKSGLEKPWNYYLSLIIERQPIVFGQPPEWYTKFERIREERREQLQMPPVNKVAQSILVDKGEETVKEDKDAIEMQKLHEASTSDITPADKANDRKSLIRNTPGFLYLLVNKPSGWAFPRIAFEEANFKSTRQAWALEQLAATTYGKDLQLYYWGYPPCVHQVKKYSPEEQKKKKAFGEKVFYYRAARLIGDVNLHPSAGKEYNWVSLKEIPEYLKDDEL